MALSNAEYSRLWRRRHKRHVREYRRKNRKKRTAQTRRWIEAHPDKVSEYKERYRGRYAEETRMYGKRWRKENPHYKKLYNKKNRNKVRAWRTVRRAVKAGKIVKPKRCTLCHKKRSLLAHHPDYSKPLEIQWICWPCHNRHHKAKK
jgi:hypothetical protein